MPEAELPRAKPVTAHQVGREFVLKVGSDRLAVCHTEKRRFVMLGLYLSEGSRCCQKRLNGQLLFVRQVRSPSLYSLWQSRKDFSPNMLYQSYVGGPLTASICAEAIKRKKAGKPPAFRPSVDHLTHDSQR